MRYFVGQTTKERAVGYCHNPNHRGYLSRKNLKNHECLKKQCKYLHKYEDHKFWIDREKKKADKKARKMNESSLCRGSEEPRGGEMGDVSVLREEAFPSEG